MLGLKLIYVSERGISVIKDVDKPWPITDVTATWTHGICIHENFNYSLQVSTAL